MKKIVFLFLVTLSLSCLNVRAQTNNVLLEFVTGTWCAWCPCGDAIADSILHNYPDALVLAYHGPPNPSGTSYNDPFHVFNGNDIITTFGMTAYPSGIVGRRTGIVGRSTWLDNVSSQTSTYPSPISISFNKVVDSIARTITLTANVIALRDIDTNVNINFVITEDNLIHSQSGNSNCTGGNSFVHKWVVRNMVNNALGESLSTGHWAAGTTKSKTWVTTLNSTWVWNNCNASVFAYFNVGSLAPNRSYILNTKKIRISIVTNVANQNNNISVNFVLNQNYPNPFNPTTNIHFTVPKDGNASLKFYDIKGTEIGTSFDGFLKAGTYNAEFDGTNYSSGIYFYKLTAGNLTETKKMMLVK